MKDYHHITERFFELQSGELNDNHAAQLHLKSCPECSEEFKWYGFAVGAMNNLEEVSPPVNFLAQLEDRLFAPKPTLWDQFRDFFAVSPYMPLPVGVSALAVLLIVGSVVYHDSSLPGVVSSTPGLVASPVQPSAPTTMVNAPVQAISLGGPQQVASLGGRGVPNIADLIGADSFTVESPGVDQAIASLKQVLPGIKGRMIEENSNRMPGESVVGVVIPSAEYQRLTTTLINHGAVTTRSSQEILPSAKKDGDNVLLYIRFVHKR